MKIKDLINTDELTERHNYENLEIDKIERQSEKITDTTLYFHLPGVKYDTRKIIPQILNKNPCAIVTEDKSAYPKTKIPIIEVKSARRAYAYAMSAFCGIDYSKLIFIGITGTNGKTTTATMLKAILEYSGKKVGFIGTGKIISNGIPLSGEDYSMTCPDPDILYPAIKRIEDDGCEIIVMEVSSHALALEKVAPIPFFIGIFTGISSEHMDFHKTMESYFSEKAKLIERATYAIINYDDKGGKVLYEKHKEKSQRIGILWQTDISATDVENLGLYGSKYIYKTEKFLTAVTLKIPGIYNIYNSMMAFTAAVKLGIKPCIAKVGLYQLQYVEGRCEFRQSDITVIVDYAHTPFALENLLKTVNCSKKDRQNMILVFGCGGERDAEKRPEMARIAEKYCNKVIVTNDNPRSEPEQNIIADIVSGFKKPIYGVISDRRDAILHTVKNASVGDVVIIAGKGHERYICDKSGYHPFDERLIINEALSLRRGGNSYADKA